jgi:uncharacterized membrane protein
LSYLITFAAYLVALVVCGLAWRVGDRPLRLAAMVYIGAWVLTSLVGHRFDRGLDVPVTIIDTNASLILIWISMRWRRLWCLVLASLALLTTIAPIVRLLHDHDVSRYVLAATENVLAICQLLVFVVAIGLTLHARTLHARTLHARRRADEGPVRS